MPKSLSAKFYYVETAADGNDKLRFRSLRNLDTTSSDDSINTLAEIYQVLSKDVYAIVEKEEVYVIN